MDCIWVKFDLSRKYVKFDDYSDNWMDWKLTEWSKLNLQYVVNYFNIGLKEIWRNSNTTIAGPNGMISRSELVWCSMSSADELRALLWWFLWCCCMYVCGDMIWCASDGQSWNSWSEVMVKWKVRVCSWLTHDRSCAVMRIQVTDELMFWCVSPCIVISFNFLVFNCFQLISFQGLDNV